LQRKLWGFCISVVVKLDRTRASVVSIVVAVLTVVPSSERFPVFIRGSVNDTGGVITGCIIHHCMLSTPGSSLFRCFVRGVMSRKLHLLCLVTLQISLHKLLNSLHSRLGSRSRSRKRRSRNIRQCKNGNSKRRTCLLTLGDLNFEKGTARGPFCLLGHRSSGGCCRHDDSCRCCWWM